MSVRAAESTKYSTKMSPLVWKYEKNTANLFMLFMNKLTNLFPTVLHVFFILSMI